MSHFDGLMRQATSVLQFTFGDAVIYRPQAGDEITLQGSVHTENVEQISTNVGRSKQAVRSIVVRSDPDHRDGGIEEPQIGSTVVADGLEYRLDGFVSSKAGTHTLRCVRLLPMERSRRDRRVQRGGR